MILCSNPKAQYLAYKEEIDNAIAGVLEGGRYIQGGQVQLFESEFAKYIGVSHGIGVGSGTEALHIALTACGVAAGDEVITVSHTAVATLAAIELCHADPVLVDIEPGFFNIDPLKIEKAITEKTKAIIAVHIYGHPIDLKPVLNIAKKYGLKVIEDCAQAHGALYDGKKAGAWGDMACFSFYPTKNLGAIGDGGMVLTNDQGLAEKAVLLRDYGWGKERVSQIPGWNSRLDELQAAVLRVKLKYLDADNRARITIASQYQEALKETDLKLPQQRKDSKHVYHLYVVRSGKRNELKEFLHEQGIAALIHYPVPAHLQPAYKGRIKVSGELKVTENACKEILSLPVYPQLGDADLKAVIKTIQDFSGQRALV